jgi:hypothetical protein
MGSRLFQEAGNIDEDLRNYLDIEDMIEEDAGSFAYAARTYYDDHKIFAQFENYVSSRGYPLDNQFASFEKKYFSPSLLDNLKGRKHKEDEAFPETVFTTELLQETDAELERIENEKDSDNQAEGTDSPEKVATETNQAGITFHPQDAFFMMLQNMNQQLNSMQQQMNNMNNSTPSRSQSITQATESTPSSPNTSILFTQKLVSGFLIAKVKESVNTYDHGRGEHTITLNSIVYRYGASLRRMHKKELGDSFSESTWAKWMKLIMQAADRAGIPKRKQGYFAITRPITAYMINVYPNGQKWFSSFVTYLAFYHFGLRHTCIANIRWKSLCSMETFRLPNIDLEFVEILLNINGFKMRNALETRKYPIAGVKNISPDHPQYLLTSPCPVFWLGVLLKERGGCTFDEFFHEKQCNSEWYISFSEHYIFSTSQEQNKDPEVFVTSPEIERKRKETMSVQYNKHLKEMVHYCGFEDWVVASVTVHQSLRRGCIVESEIILRNNPHLFDTRNTQLAWNRNSALATSSYDSGAISQLGHYANSMFSMLPSVLPRNRDMNIFLPQGVEVNFTHHHLIEFIRKAHEVDVTWFLNNRFPPNFYCLENLQLVHDVIYAIQMDKMGSEKSKKDPKIREHDREHAIMLAVHRKLGRLDRPSVLLHYEVHRKEFLCMLTGMRRDVMANFIFEFLRREINLDMDLPQKLKDHAVRYYV